MFQNKVFLTIVALGAIQAVPHNESYGIKPGCNNSHSAGHYKSNSYSYTLINGDASNMDTVHASVYKNNQEDLSHEDNNIKDSSNVNEVKNAYSPKQIDGVIHTGTPSKENNNKTDRKLNIPAQRNKLKVNKAGVNKDTSNFTNIEQPKVDMKSANSMDSMNNNTLESNDIKNIDFKHKTDNINSLNNENQANLNINNNTLKASGNASNNINISSQPNQQNFNSVELNNNMGTLLKAIPGDQITQNTTISENKTSNSAPQNITDSPFKKIKPDVETGSKVGIMVPEDKKEYYQHNSNGAYGQSYSQ